MRAALHAGRLAWLLLAFGLLIVLAPDAASAGAPRPRPVLATGTTTDEPTPGDSADGSGDGSAEEGPDGLLFLGGALLVGFAGYLYTTRRRPDAGSDT